MYYCKNNHAIKLPIVRPFGGFEAIVCWVCLITNAPKEVKDA